MPDTGKAAAGTTPEADAAATIAAGYSFSGPALELGTVVLDGAAHPDARIRVPLGMLNRHGLIAGATGTGKTKTLQVLAEQLCTAGVPVVVADIKGDLSGLSQAGTPNEKITQRAADTSDDWVPAAFPVEFYALGGVGTGIPLRATMTSFGPTLLAKVLGLNATQESSLGLIFHYADTAGLPLLDLKDLRSVIQYLTSEEGKNRPEGHRRAVERDRRRDPAQPGHAGKPRRRRVLRRAGVRDRRPVANRRERPWRDQLG